MNLAKISSPRVRPAWVMAAVAAVLAMTGFRASGVASGSAISPCHAWIVTRLNSGDMSVSAEFKNGGESSVSVSYSLTTERKGKSGESSSSQKGKVDVKGNSRSVLSSVNVNVGPDDFYFIKLTTFVNGKLFSKDSVLKRW